MNTITVLFFSTLRGRAGVKAIDLSLPLGHTVKELKRTLVDTLPALEEAMSSVVVSINREFAFDETVIPENAEVALFPPVSGG